MMVITITIKENEDGKVDIVLEGKGSPVTKKEAVRVKIIRNAIFDVLGQPDTSIEYKKDVTSTERQVKPEGF